MDLNTIKAFEELGEHSVRLKLNSSGFNEDFHNAAIVWLAMKDQERERRIESDSLENKRMARSANTAATVAAIAAIAANILSIITIIIGVLAWMYPKH